MPQAWGDVVPEGGRSGEPKARTGGAAGSPPGMFAPGARGGKRAPLKVLSRSQLSTERADQLQEIYRFY